MTQYAAEADARWGSTEAYRESQRRTSEYSEDDWRRLGAESDVIEQELADCLRAGLSEDSDRVRAAVEQHRRHIDTWFYPCSHEMQAALADMYVADERFAAHYDSREPGLAAYVRDAIHANALQS